MNIAMLLEMAADGGPDRRAVGELNYPELLERARRAAAWFGTQPAGAVGVVGC